ncbi:MAG: tetratricopeptide repeat protein [Rhodocyclaceae bacterium]|nr:MAG: tetratricopeptide repeat protein [Rhodocyclaceae bacterium]
MNLRKCLGAVLIVAAAAANCNAHAGSGQKDFAAGFELIKAGKLQAAVAKFLAGLKAEPNNGQAHFYLAEAYRGLQQNDKAKTHYQKSLEVDPFGAVAQDAKDRLSQLGSGEGGQEASTPAQTAGGRAGKAAEPAPGSGWTEATTGMEFVWVPSGCFVMGSGDGDNNERPPHKVCLKGFYLGRYEVTQSQYQTLTGKNPSSFKGSNLPVESVSWGEAKSFADEMAYRSKERIRLPSEAEWEYACRSGEQNELCGRGSIENLAWYESNSGKTTHPVGQKRANAWGLHDMSGNVWEWVEDCYNSYQGAPTDGSASITGDCSRRVKRGGSWSNTPASVRSAGRSRDGPSDRIDFLGFRVARTLP